MAEEKKTTSTTAKKTTSTAAKKTTSTATKKTTSTAKAEAPKTAPAVEEKKVEAPVAEQPKAEAKVETKPAKTEKKDAKKVEKPIVTEAKATAYDVRVTPRKARLVIDLIRGKDVNEALGILSNVNKAASPIIAKVVKSAAANAINNFGMHEDKLFVATAYANEGIKMKRFLPRAKGSASGLVKRASHITIIVKER